MNPKTFYPIVANLLNNCRYKIYKSTLTVFSTSIFFSRKRFFILTTMSFCVPDSFFSFYYTLNMCPKKLFSTFNFCFHFFMGWGRSSISFVSHIPTVSSRSLVGLSNMWKQKKSVIYPEPMKKWKQKLKVENNFFRTPCRFTWVNNRLWLIIKMKIYSYVIYIIYIHHYSSK